MNYISLKYYIKVLLKEEKWKTKKKLHQTHKKKYTLLSYKFDFDFYIFKLMN